jgi:flavorubredoxin
MQTGKRILVVYYSLTGNTERVARDLAARLGAEVERIDDRKSRRGFLGHLSAALDSVRERPAQIADISKYPNDYALTLIGTPTWGGKMTPAVRAYLRMVRGRINEVAFFTTSGMTSAEQVVPAMEALVGRKAIAFSGFTGRELYSAALYERKSAAFVETLRAERHSSIPQYDHAHSAA